MNVINPKVEILSKINRSEILTLLEIAGRTCYKSEDKITEESSIKFIKHINNNKHHSVLEHVSITVKFICSRACANQIVRHRIASYSQESQRYCNYSKDKFKNKITVIKPYWLKEYQEVTWYKSIQQAEENYFTLLDMGCSPEEARDVLPNCTKTELVTTMNLRSWIHFFELRCDNHAQNEIRLLADSLKQQFNELLPELF